jgi:hypothetical protein
VKTLREEAMEIRALEAVVQILHEDLAKALATGNKYRANAAAQWARDAAHRARKAFPWLLLTPEGES